MVATDLSRGQTAEGIACSSQLALNCDYHLISRRLEEAVIIDSHESLPNDSSTSPMSIPTSGPLVSVIIPAKDAAPFISTTLESVIAQTYHTWEVVVIDDGSTDKTGEIVLGFAQDDTRIRVIGRRGSRGGAQVARNQGLEQSRGEYVIFLDSDDLLGPSCLENRVSAMENIPSLDFCVFGMERFYEHLGDFSMNRLDAIALRAYQGSDDLDAFFSTFTPWITTGAIWRRSALIQIGGWDEEVRLWQDWDIHVRALLVGLTYCRVNATDNYHRMLRAGSTNLRPGVGGDCSLGDRAAALSFVLNNAVMCAEASGALSTHRKRLLAWTYWNAAVSLLRSDPKASVDVRRQIRKLWWDANRLDLVGSALTQIGTLGIELNRVRYVGRVVHSAAKLVLIIYMFAMTHRRSSTRSVHDCTAGV